MINRLITLLVLLTVIIVGVASFAYAEIYIEGLENEMYNLGDIVLLEGYVQEQKSFSGDLEIISYCGDDSRVLLFSFINLDAGEKHGFSQDFPVKRDAKNINSSCYFTVSVEGGDVFEEKRSGEFIVTNKLRIESDIDVLTQKPGKDVIISGVIRKADGLRVKSGSVALTLNGKVFGSGLSDGAFSYRITLPEDISSGEQIVLIKARDLEGNDGDGDARFRVISVPEELIISIDKDTYKPNEMMNIVVSLIDQSGKNVFGTSTVQLIDPNGNDASTKVVDNGNEFEIFLDEVTIPGTWILRAENKGFEANKKFYVVEIKEKEIKMEGNKLIIRNIGNVDYEDPIQINMKSENGEEFEVIKRTLLKPNQTIIVDLNDEVPTGKYGVKVGGSLITGNVVLEGSGFENLKQNTTAGYFALVFVFLFLIFIVVTKGRRRFSGRKVARERGKEILYAKNVDDDAVSRAVMRNREIARKREEKERKDIGSSLMRASKEDVDHMINRIKKEVPVDSDEKRSDRGSPFNIFD